MKISVFLIVSNEEDKIERTLEALKWADERVVVDGGSKDRTVEICRRMGAQVHLRHFDNFANQKNHALSLCQGEWALSIDADEIVSPELACEIKETIHSPDPLSGYYIPRSNYFLGRPLRFSGQRENVLRLFQKGNGKFVGAVHETVQLNGPVGALRHPLYHYGTRNLGDYFRKLNLYTDLEAKRFAEEKKIPSLFKALLFPPAKWVLNYLFYGGFLDGRSGFFYHVLTCYYDWVKNWKARFSSL